MAATGSVIGGGGIAFGTFVLYSEAAEQALGVAAMEELAPVDRLAHVQNLRRQIEQRWGGHVLLDAGQSGGLARSRQYATRHAVSTGFDALDRALGGAGLPRGRIVELCGARTSGKTSLALRLLGQVQRDGGLAAYVDPSRAFHPPSADALGVFLPSLLLIRPRNALQALDATASLLRDQICELIVHDLAGGGPIPDTASLATLAMLASKAGTLLVFLTLSRAHRRLEGEGKPTALDSFATVQLHVQRFATPVTPPSPRSRRALPTAPFAIARQRGDEKLLAFVRHTEALEEDARGLVASASLTAPVPSLAGARISVTVVKNKLGASGMTIDVDILQRQASPYVALPTAMGRELREDEDRVYLGAGLPDLVREAALAGAGGAAARDRRRAV